MATAGGTGGEDGAPPEPGLTRSVGCDAATPLKAGMGSVAFAGEEREFKLYLPDNYAQSAEPWPLVFALHPTGVKNGASYWDDKQLAEAAAGKAIVVGAASSKNGAGVQEWHLPENQQRNLAYFDALLALTQANLCVDTSRIFALGFSAGGGFASALSCLRDDIRGFASSGSNLHFELLTMKPEECPGKPAAWIDFGTGESQPGRALLRDFWRQRNGCDPNEAAGADLNASPPCSTYTCAGEAVVHCAHNGGHEWPSFGSAAAIDFFLGLKP
jgi:poly(3-hydroxybutyrate) depolymerase